MRSLCWTFILVSLLFIGVHVSAQNPQAPTPSLPPPLHQEQSGPDDEARARMEKEMAKKANLGRQQQLKKDTANLLKLATELQQYVDKTNESVLSLEVIKKADQIEKLAHSVKEKMRGEP